LRIAHLSDLHFAKIGKGLGQFFSKAWIGNLNVVLNRGFEYSPIRPYAVIDLLKREKVTDVIISGDLTITSSKKEFALAKQFIHALENEKVNVYVIPGNHDHYTKSAYRKRLFYHYFPKMVDGDCSYNLARDGVTAKKLFSHWWLVLMDTALATSWKSSNGLFSPSIESALKNLLKEIPSEDKILLVNHFPFFQHDRPKRRLKRGEVLEKILKSHPNIQFYLHGHTHRRCVADLRTNHLPIILDSGSTAYAKGSWNLLDLQNDQCDLKVFSWKSDQWSPIENHHFRWPHE
jgi:3',5'-cyclic AMP phosphodiesterase CpdA